MVPIRIAALVAAAALVLTAAPAHAQTVERTDRRGDAPASIDVARATYTHGAETISVVARVPRLGDRGTAALSLSKFEIFEAGYVVRIRKRPGREPRVRLFFFNHFDLEPRTCSAVSGSWGPRRVTLSVARSCLVDHAQDTMFAQLGLRRGADVDFAPAVKRLRRG
jgi:hypothetical protein